MFQGLKVNKILFIKDMIYERLNFNSHEVDEWITINTMKQPEDKKSS
jgi:hypothetical protein